MKRLLAVSYLTLMLIFGLNSVLYAQNDPDIVDVIGTKFGLLKLYFRVNKQKAGDIARAQVIKKTFIKYLKWSGIFKLQKEKFSADLSLTVDFFHQIHVSIESNEGIQLYYASTNEITEANREEEIISIIEDIIYQLTGQKSILRSAIAFIQKSNGSGHQLVLIDSFGNNRHVLVDDGEINVLPRWKQDASGIMYTSLRKFGGRLMYFDFASKKTSLLMKLSNNLSGGTWDRSAKKLVVSIANQGNTDLYLINSKTGNKQLTYRSSIESNPSLSPDGTRLLFVSNRSGSIQIYQKSLSTDETFRMTFEGSYNVEPRWSRDGNFIVYAGIVKGKFQIFFMDKDGLWAKQITKGNKSSEQPVWSPDGRQILYLSRVNNDQKLYIMRIDGSFSRRVTKSGKGINEINPAWVQEHKWKY